MFAMAVTLASLSSSALATEFKRIRDVNVSCTSTLRCDLFIANPRITLANIGIRRSAAPDAPVSLFFTTRDPFVSGSEIIFEIDGNAVGTIDVATLSYRAAVSEYMSRDEEFIQSLIAASADARLLQVQYQTRSGFTTAEFRLSGFREALEFMDETQGRTRADALAGVLLEVDDSNTGGSVAVSTIDRLTDIPLPIRVRYFAGTQSRCSGLSDDRVQNLGGTALELGDDRLLVVPCGRNTGDSVEFALLSTGGGDGEQISVPVVTPDTITTAQILSDVSIDVDTGQITGFVETAPGCGARYVYDAVATPSGPNVRLVEARVKTECSTEDDLKPESWPLIWPVSG